VHSDRQFIYHIQAKQTTKNKVNIKAFNCRLLEAFGSPKLPQLYAK